VAAAAEFGVESVEAVGPELAVAVQPGVDLLEGDRVDRVEAAGAVDGDGGEAVVAEYPEVLGDGGLADAELFADRRGDPAGRQLPVGEQLQDPAPDRIAENVEGVHGSTISVMTYISNRSEQAEGLRSSCRVAAVPPGRSARRRTAGPVGGRPVGNEQITARMSRTTTPGAAQHGVPQPAQYRWGFKL
jgi:hypothetical protein